MKLTKTQVIYSTIALIIIGGAVYASFWIFSNSTELDLPSFTVSLLSLAIASLAFIIALQTFISIDSVNKITKMEGNILENEHYVLSVPSLINEYQANNLRDTEDAIFTELHLRFKKKSKTAVEFSDNLQYFIDLLVFFPALFARSSDEEKQDLNRKIDGIVKVMEQRKKELLIINTGNLILIDETVKLIRGVLDYQNLTRKQEFGKDTKLLEVRGPMLKNSVTKTIYYNYLGLMFNKKAMNILKRELPIKDNKDLFELDQLKLISSSIDQLTGNEKEITVMFLQESKAAFEKALESAKEDVMWQGFIQYNDARSSFFLEVVTGENSGEWLKQMETAISARSKLNILIAEVIETEKTHFQSFFLYQEELVRLVKINLQLAQNRDDQALLYKGVNLHVEKSYKDLFPDPNGFKRLVRYQEGIKRHLQE
ncbi:hypothetical protein [Oceanobacillus kapialis]|uniref:Uncharacterized protein n=1 Tax=Oceanobacillus kapialis TaxID=481353 RepID=A0ABW5Q342_9BACI